ncbi:hypothetical protein [Cellulosilyticum ruminicola]|uniref:hypothetical protein n=1 Tax=Cellulosilyticum ruminicola TaxID=425254 RepID=UPI0006D08CAA|nr:hypothetical protein [Cellulosilyticum ruminicola]
MLGKLLKYEIKATAMTFLVMYVAILALAISNMIFNQVKFNSGIVITLGILVFSFIALGIVTIIMAVQRFNKNLLGDEGYLMFTLPVSSSQIIISKLLVTIIWVFASCIIAFLTFIILYNTYSDGHELAQLITEIKDNWNELNTQLISELHMSVYSFMAWIGSGVLLGLTEFILMIYTALTIAQLPPFSKHRGLCAFGIYVGIDVVLNNVIMTALIAIVGINQLDPKLIMIGGCGFAAVSSVILFICTNFILSKHLNLE